MKGICRDIANGILIMAAAGASPLPANDVFQASVTEQSLSAVPQDVRTALRILDVEPEILRSICCPKCFSQYPLSTKEISCQQRDAIRSKKCEAPLFGEDNRPKKLYVSQSFTHWLSSFVKRPGYQQLLETSRTRDAGRQVPQGMYDIWDSPLWLNLIDKHGLPYFKSCGSLGFSLFVDWFNPLGNKAAGMIAIPPSFNV